MPFKIFAFVAVVLTANLLDSALTRVVDPSIQTSLAVDAVNGSNTELQAYRVARDWASPWLLVVYAGAASALFGPSIITAVKSLRKK